MGEFEGRLVRELEGRSVKKPGDGPAAESVSSSGVGRRPIARVRTRRGRSSDQALLGMFGGLDEVN